MKLQIKDDKVLFGCLSMVVSSIAASAHNVFVKELTFNYTTAEILFYRNSVAFFVFIIVLLLVSRESINIRLHPKIVYLRSVLSLAAWVFAIISLKLLPLNQAVTIWATCPVFATCIAIALRFEPARLTRIIAVAVGLFGFGLASLDGFTVNFWGVTTAVLSSLAQAIGIVVVRGASREISSNIFTFNALVVLILSAGIFLPVSTSAAPIPTDLMLIVFVGMGLAYLVTLWCGNTAYRLAPITYVIGLQNLPIVWLTLFEYITTGIPPEVSIILGAGLIVSSAIYLASGFGAA
ncbi:MAG: DMT family transporter [Gammaproteobacteria bacterium]|nr:DMT family transporter [Gammaproteobacteria bacterium]